MHAVFLCDLYIYEFRHSTTHSDLVVVVVLAQYERRATLFISKIWFIFLSTSTGTDARPKAHLCVDFRHLL